MNTEPDITAQLLYESSVAPGPHLSVLLPFKNEASTLPLVLDSLAGQEVSFPYELIALDGCSSDASVEVIRKHDLCRRVAVRIYGLPPENHGQMVAVNFGASVAKADVLLLVQADVFFRDPHALSKLCDVMADSTVVATTYVSLGTGEFLKRYDFWGRVFQSRYQWNQVSGAFDTKFNAVRRSAFWQIGGFDTKTQAWSAGDADLQVRLGRNGKIVSTNIEVYHLHGLGKKFTVGGCFTKYMRNAEAFAVGHMAAFRNRSISWPLITIILQQGCICAACIASFILPYRLISVGIVLLMAIWWLRHAFLRVRTWRVLALPFFGVAVMYGFAFVFLVTLIRGRSWIVLKHTS